MSVLMPDRKPLKRAREWMIDHVPIRQRLALWYVTLVGLTLFLFSVIGSANTFSHSACFPSRVIHS